MKAWLTQNNKKSIKILAKKVYKEALGLFSLKVKDPVSVQL